ncbi:hypothetical protein HELRODRAFT_183204 [Helobdella robusta]|uniref:Uncharacterized protein n=1 Tax=Helobdella robusta TaxID=6412 RepID=T1FJA9_HELRO|nr:hypothetical protein HELRODRAFT_183204 [Helobdella robusta]ESO11418.1 hypothetical protein HELRODRAFT_183204 [Helobdella robusta]
MAKTMPKKLLLSLLSLQRLILRIKKKVTEVKPFASILLEDHSIPWAEKPAHFCHLKWNRLQSKPVSATTITNRRLNRYTIYPPLMFSPMNDSETKKRKLILVGSATVQLKIASQ